MNCIFNGRYYVNLFNNRILRGVLLLDDFFKLFVVILHIGIMYACLNFLEIWRTQILNNEHIKMNQMQFWAEWFLCSRIFFEAVIIFLKTRSSLRDLFGLGFKYIRVFFIGLLLNKDTILKNPISFWSAPHFGMFPHSHMQHSCDIWSYLPTEAMPSKFGACFKCNWT